MKIFLSIFFMLNFFSSTVKCDQFISAGTPFIEYTGRIDFSDTEAPVFSYSGVSIRACFNGNEISAILEDEKGENYYNIIIDGSIFCRLKCNKGKETYKLAADLKSGTHEIEIFKLTEEMFGKTTFHGFVLGEKASINEIKNKRDKLIEYIGNSITCGYGNEGKLGMTFGASTENHFMTYAAITSRNFKARHLAVCKSGIGIYRNWDGPKEGNIDCMPNYYDRIFLYDEFPKYDFKETPDLICINLGTNDFSTNGGDSSMYVEGYLKFIDNIQTHYNNPDILILLGPMMEGNTLEKVRRYLEFIKEAANKKHKGNVYFFEMSQQTGEPGVDYHPTIAQHEKNAQELTGFISKIKGWKVGE